MAKVIKHTSIMKEEGFLYLAVILKAMKILFDKYKMFLNRACLATSRK